MWKKCKSILLCAAFTVSRGTQAVQVIPLWNWARKAWVGQLLKSHRYLQSGCFMGHEGWVVGQALGLGRGCLWLGTQRTHPRPTLPHCGKRWIRFSTPDPPQPFHPPDASPDPSWPGMVWSPISLPGCLHQHKGDEVLWPPKLVWVWWHFSLPAPSLPPNFVVTNFPSCSHRDVLKGCSLSWDCIFALATVFCHLNVSWEITLQT